MRTSRIVEAICCLMATTEEKKGDGQQNVAATATKEKPEVQATNPVSAIEEEKNGENEKKVINLLPSVAPVLKTDADKFFEEMNARARTANLIYRVINIPPFIFNMLLFFAILLTLLCNITNIFLTPFLKLDFPLISITQMLASFFIVYAITDLSNLVYFYYIDPIYRGKKSKRYAAIKYVEHLLLFGVVIIVIESFQKFLTLGAENDSVIDATGVAIVLLSAAIMLASIGLWKKIRFVPNDEEKPEDVDESPFYW